MPRMKKSSKFMLGIALITSGAAISAPALAANITFNFYGVVDSSESGNFPTGSSISGSYTFDSTTLDSIPTDPTVGAYSSSGILSSATFTIGSNIYESSDSSVFIGVTTNDYLNYPFGSTYGISSPVFTGDPFGQESGFSLQLYNSTQNVFSSDALPLTPPNVDLFANRIFQFNYNYLSGGDTVLGTINSIEVAVVPEPSPVLGTLAFAAFGAAFCLFKKQKLVKH